MDGDLSVSTSASLQHSRREGGPQALLSEEVTDTMKTVTPKWSLWSDLGKALHNGQVRPLRTSVNKLVCQLADKAIPEARVVGVPERGWKTRFVTTADEALTLALTPICNQMRRVLRKIPECRGSQKDDHVYLTKIVNQLNRSLEAGYKPMIHRSTDLKTSTDTIPFGVSEAVVGGFLDWLGTKMNRGSEGYRRLEELLYKSIGPYKLHTPKGTFTTCCGVLMGTPISFIILNIVHSFILRKVLNPQNSGRLAGFSRVKGDDGLLLMKNSEGFVAYTNLLESMIAKVNHMKDYVSSTAFVFLERLVVLDDTRRYSLINIPPMRQILSYDGQSVTTKELTLMEPTVYRRLARATTLSRASGIKKLWNKGVFPFIPVALGGAGFLPMAKYRPFGTVPRWARQLFQYLLEVEDPETLSLLMTRIRYSSSRERDRVGFDAAEERYNKYFSIMASDDPDEIEIADKVVSIHDWVSSCIGGIIKAQLLLGKILPRKTFNAPVRRLYSLYKKVQPKCGMVPKNGSVQDYLDRIYAKLAKPVSVPKTSPIGLGMPVTYVWPVALKRPAQD
jgi:hypothetical protein